MMPRIKQNGFTLVETLVAITIMTIAIVGPMFSVYKALQATYIARAQLTATGLAQEAEEYVQNIRDENYLYNIDHPGAPVSWLANLDECLKITGCAIDPRFYPQKAGSCTQTGCRDNQLYLDSSGRYTLLALGNIKTPYVRQTNITQVSAYEAVVKTTVTWTTFRIPYTVTVTDHLYNWL